MADTNQDQTLSEAPLISSDPTPPSTETAPESVVKETEAAPAPARTSVTIAPAPATEEPPKQSEPVVASKAPSTIDLVEESKQPEPTPAPLPTTETTETKYGYLEKKEVYTKPNAILPEDSDLSYAKSFLKAGGDVNVYDHMTAIVMRMLETRPNNPIDMFEMISSDLKRTHFKVDQPNIPASFKRIERTSDELKLAEAQLKFMANNPSEEQAEGSGDSSELPDILELSKLWEWANISFGQEETYLLLLSLKKLAEEKSLKSVRLWGKILGTVKNYIIVEGELKDNVNDDEEAAIANGVSANGEEPVLDELEEKNINNGEKQPGEDGGEHDAALPKLKIKTVPPVPREGRNGANKYVYYVCNHAGGVWTRLPDVIPEKLQVSRKIRKYFTGNLTTPVKSYPAFDATEAQYLRCQIARISASTVVSPAGYYTFDPEEEEADENEKNTHVIINNEYESISNENLLNLANWVHHISYILPQGRVTWENPYIFTRGGEAEEEEDEEGEGSQSGDNDKNEGKNLEPEQGPAILTPLTGDDDNGDVPSWSSRACALYAPTKFNPVLLRSTRWPGATTVAYNDKFSNIYIGDGLKSLGNPEQTFVLPSLPELQNEYTPAEGVTFAEANDPTVEEEKAFELSQKKAEEANKDAEDGDEDGGDAEEDD